jgi:hypothetical protein
MTAQYGAYVLRAGLARLYARIRMYTPTCSETRTHARTHTDQYVIPTAFPRKQWFRELASLLRHTYTACLVKFYIRIWRVIP